MKINCTAELKRKNKVESFLLLTAEQFLFYNAHISSGIKKVYFHIQAIAGCRVIDVTYRFFKDR